MVKKVEWDDSLLLDVPDIDKQHRELLSLMNRLYDACGDGGRSYEIRMPDIVGELTDYTVYHFSYEEKYMETFGYMNLALHKAQHSNFITHVKEQAVKLSDADPRNGLALYDYLSRWIVNHIAKSDRAWALAANP